MERWSKLAQKLLHQLSDFKKSENLDSRRIAARQTGRTHRDDVALHDKPSLNTHQGASSQEVDWN